MVDMNQDWGQQLTAGSLSSLLRDQSQKQAAMDATAAWRQQGLDLRQQGLGIRQKTAYGRAMVQMLPYITDPKAAQSVLSEMQNNANNLDPMAEKSSYLRLKQQGINLPDVDTNAADNEIKSQLQQPAQPAAQGQSLAAAPATQPAQQPAPQSQNVNMDVLGKAMQITNSIRDDASYQAAKPAIQALGIDVSGAPQSYDKSKVNDFRNSLITLSKGVNQPVQSAVQPGQQEYNPSAVPSKLPPSLSGADPNPLAGVNNMKPTQVLQSGRKLNIQPSQFATKTQIGNYQSFTDPNGATGKNIIANNTFFQHVDEYSQIAKALDNGDVQWLNKNSNMIKNALGYSGPIALNTVGQALAGEYVKAATGDGAVGDREKAMDLIGDGLSKQQYTVTTNVMKRLAADRANSLKTAYSGANLDSFGDFSKLLNPKLAAEMKNSQQQANVGDQSVNDVQVGQVYKGHVYLGGDKTKQTSWKKAQ